MKTANEIYAFFYPLWTDIIDSESFEAKKPFLAHYTSISTLECILKNNEVWFSNPLFMNDLEELRFGILEGAAAFRRHSGIKEACKTPAQYAYLLEQFEEKFNLFDSKHALDTYVFCLTEHNLANTDGVLSMWRGYGSNGNGAAIVFNPSQFVHTENSPLIIDKVNYLSGPQRLQWIDVKLSQFAQLLRSIDIPNEMLYLPVHSLFERLKMFALFTKHHGFLEEQEWRIVYLRERDSKGYLNNMLDYAVGRNGIEPKLKYKIKPIEGLTRPDLSLESLIEKIILGPALSNPLAQSAVKRMLERLEKPSLANKVTASTTPYRATI